MSHEQNIFIVLSTNVRTGKDFKYKRFVPVPGEDAGMDLTARTRNPLQSKFEILK